MFNASDDKPQLNGFWYSIFRPVGNRYYIGMKTYTIAFVIQYVPAGVLLIILSLTVPSDRRWAAYLILTIWIIAALIDFFIIRKWEEQTTWKMLYGKFYNSTSEGTVQDYDLMKKVDNNPTPQNIEQLKDDLENK